MSIQPDEVALSTPELEALAHALARQLIREPLAEEAMVAAGLAHLTPRLGPLEGTPPDLARRLTAALLVERRRHAGPDVQLVWTGPEAITGAARDTATVVRELFARARRSVLIAGYSFDHGTEILAPLHSVMQNFGVETHLFVDIPRSEQGRVGADVVTTWAKDFFLQTWPFPRKPALCFDPRAAMQGSYSSLHAKCIVVDERHALITSANFTDRGQGRNVEVGALVDAPSFARSLVAQWLGALAAGVFVNIDDFAGR